MEANFPRQDVLQLLLDDVQNERRYRSKYDWIRYNGDYEIVLAAVRANGLNLEHANETLQADRAIVLAAVQQNASALHFVAGDCFYDDHEIMLTAVQRSGSLLKHATIRLRGDKDIVLAAVQNWGRAFRFVDFTSQFVRDFASKLPTGQWEDTPQCARDARDLAASLLRPVVLLNVTAVSSLGEGNMYSVSVSTLGGTTCTVNLPAPVPTLGLRQPLSRNLGLAEAQLVFVYQNRNYTYLNDGNLRP